MTAQPLKVMLFSNSRVRGGVEEHILTLLRGLDRTRFHLHLVCSPDVAERLAGDIPEDVELSPLFLLGPRHAAAARQFARLLRDHRIDILHSHQFRASLVASPLGRLCGVPVIVETPHIREHWRQGRLKSRFFIDRAVGKLVDAFIAVSKANGRYLVEEKRLPGRKVTVIENGCDVAKYRWHGERVARLRARLGFEETDPVLISIGRLEPQKGHGVLLAAMPALVREYPRLRLVCVGEGSLHQDLLNQVSRLQLGPAVHFAGFQADIATWLGMADIMVLPSFFEGLPLVAMEALAARRAVVATAVDGTPEVVRNEVTGLTVPPGDPAKLGRAIARLLGDPALRDRLARQGQEWVQAHFDQRRQVWETEQLYLRLWRERGGSWRTTPREYAEAVNGDRRLG